MMAVVAGLGVLNTVLLGTRDRVHDLGVFKAVGMTPRQTIAMVVCWIVGPAIAAAVIAMPAGTVLHSVTVQAMGNAANTGIPASFVHVYRPSEFALLALSGLAIAVAGALLPAPAGVGAPDPQGRRVRQRARSQVLRRRQAVVSPAVVAPVPAGSAAMAGRP